MKTMAAIGSLNRSLMALSKRAVLLSAAALALAALLGFTTQANSCTRARALQAVGQLPSHIAGGEFVVLVTGSSSGIGAELAAQVRWQPCCA